MKRNLYCVDKKQYKFFLVRGQIKIGGMKCKTT